jgi:transposase-like protein
MTERCPTCGYKRNPESVARKQEIVAQAIEGKLLREIAEAVGVSKAYAHKVVSEAGLRRRTGYVRTGDS